MPRPKGTRDSDYEAKRRELLRRMTVRMMRREAPRLSLRDLAAAAEVTVPTLRHYFGGRHEVIDAILEDCLRLGHAGLRAQALPEKPFDDSMRDYARQLIDALDATHAVRLGDIFAVSLAEGLQDATVSRSTLRHILDPTLEALEDRLRAHIARGEMIDTNPRAAALTMLSPLLLASLHQNQLQGADLRPMSLGMLAEDVSAAFVRAYRAEPQDAAAQPADRRSRPR